VPIEDWRVDYNQHRPPQRPGHNDPSRVRRQPPSASAAAPSNCVWGRGRSRIPASQR
jgi:hypothetical protein